MTIAEILQWTNLAFIPLLVYIIKRKPGWRRSKC